MRSLSLFLCLFISSFVLSHLAKASEKLQVLNIKYSLPEKNSSAESQQNILEIKKLVSQSPRFQKNQDIFFIYRPADLPSSSTINPEEIMVLGLNQRQVLYAARDAQLTQPCSKYHQHDDIANRWCHTLFVKSVEAQLEILGVDPVLSKIVSSSLIAVKEYGIDLNPSKADMAVSFENSMGGSERSSFELSAFADGALFLTLKRKLGPRTN